MVAFVGTQLPMQKGSGEAFEQTLQAPPVVRVDIRASKDWFARTEAPTRQMAADRIVEEFSGLIQQIVYGQRQNYQLGDVQMWRKMLRFPGLDVEYTMRAGYETIILTVYPESVPDTKTVRKITINIGDVLSAKFGVGPDDPGYGGNTNESGFFAAWNHPMQRAGKFYYEVHVRQLSFDVPYPKFTLNYGGPGWPATPKQVDPYTYSDGSGFRVDKQYPRSWLGGAMFGVIWRADKPDADEPKKYYDSGRTFVTPTGQFTDRHAPAPRSVYAQPWWTQAGDIVQTSSDPDRVVTTLHTNFGNGVRTDAYSGSLGNRVYTVGRDNVEQVIVLKGDFETPTYPLAPALDAPDTASFGIYGYGCWSGVSFDVQAEKDVYMIAVDVSARKVWFGRNGKWANGGDPSKNLAETMTLDDVGAGAYYPAMQVNGLNFYGVPNAQSTLNWQVAPLWVDSVFSPDLLVYDVPPGFQVSRATTIEVDIP